MFPRRGMQDWWQYDGFERNDELKITSKHNKKKQTIKYKDKNKQGKSEKKVEKKRGNLSGREVFHCKWRYTTVQMGPLRFHTFSEIKWWLSFSDEGTPPDTDYIFTRGW